MLDDYAVQGRLRGLDLILQALILGWGVTETSSQRYRVDRSSVSVAGTNSADGDVQFELRAVLDMIDYNRNVRPWRDWASSL
jgi:hypothetical protein